MTDRAFCESLCLGQPLLSLDALCELRAVLDARLGLSTGEEHKKENSDGQGAKKAASLAVERSNRPAFRRAGSGVAERNGGAFAEELGG